MDPMNFKKLNNISGWVVFAIAAITYLLTIEPTASLWDCGEFIATSYKLEVGHPPGTPFFFLINRFGAMFAMDPTQVAPIINSLSALESAFTILFLFWSISHLGRRIYGKKAEDMTTDQSWAVIGAAAIGALAFTFTDSFWFSAVEAEVYALSSMFTALVFWAILKWEDVADQPRGNRWLILIAYLMGLSIGAHILNLLAIPALVFIFYFKKYPNRPKIDLWKPAVMSVLVLGGFYMLTPTVISIGGFIDRIFVNTLSMPINSGLLFFILALLAGLGFGVWYSHKAQRAILNVIFLSAAMVVIGFSTYGIVLIRATTNPPMNSNAPSNAYTLERFINRDQYGSRPLMYGHVFSSQPVDYDFGDYYFVNENSKYQHVKFLRDYKYDPAADMLFPRMYSDREDHIRDYKIWSNFQGKQIRSKSGDMITVPTFGDNLTFFFSYQVNNMYWRYFLWNFVGRQSDTQYDGITNGNWLSGINAIDNLYLGPQDNLPDEVAANRGRNTYFFLPFILGLIGIFFQLKRDGRNFTVVMMLFFMTGLAIVLYLNQTPQQPRERDYAYAGSFYAFAIWIGLGVLPIYELFKKKLAGKTAAIGAVILTASVPTVLAVQNWDDHDRSGRTIQRDMGRNYLDQLLPNSILLLHGDNDTFSAWYNQEVENYQTSIRPLNTQYITGDWYIDQMRVRANDSDPLPISIPRSKYWGQETTPSYPVVEVARPGGGEWTIKEVMEVINSDDPTTKFQGRDFIPAKRIAVPVNRENVLKSGIVKPEDAHLIQDTIYITLKKEHYNIGELVVLDLIAQTDWKRAIYSTSAAYWLDFGLVTYDKTEQSSYMQQCGSVQMLVPIKTPITTRMGIGRIDTDQLYKHLMVNAKFGNVADPKVYLCSFTENTLRTVRYRETFARLANELTAQGDSVKAIQVLDQVMEVLPVNKYRYNTELVPVIEAYWNAGQHAKGDALAKDYIRNIGQYVDYYDRFTGKQGEYVDGAIKSKLSELYDIAESAKASGKEEIYNLILKKFDTEQ